MTVVSFVDVVVAPEAPLAAAGVLHRHVLVVCKAWVLLCARWPASAAALKLPFLVHSVLVECRTEDCARNRAHPVDLREEFIGVLLACERTHSSIITTYPVVVPMAENDSRSETARRVDAAAGPGHLSRKEIKQAIIMSVHLRQ